MIEVDLNVFQYSFTFKNYLVFYRVDKSKEVTVELLKALLDAVYYDVIDKLKLSSKLFVAIDKSKYSFFQSVPGKFRFFQSIPDQGKEFLLL